MNSTIKLPVFLLLLLLALHSAPAQVPAILNYQGRVTIGGTNLTTGNAKFKFALVAGNGSSIYWRNDGGTNAGEPSTSVTVPLNQGLYSTLLGDTNAGNMAAIPVTVFTNADVRLRVWFSDGTGGFVQLVPDQRIASAGYALRAAAADTASISNVAGNLTVSGGLSALQIVGGQGNVATSSDAFIGGGRTNTAAGLSSVIAGGELNEAGEAYSVVGGGYFNSALGYASVISGGYDNRAQGLNATVPGGYLNRAQGSDSFAAGVQSSALHDGSFVWNSDASVQTESTNALSFTVRAPGGLRFITTQVDSTTVTNGVYGSAGLTNGVFLAPNSGAWASLSDSNAKTKITAIKPREILARLSAVPVTEWEYKADPQRRYIGPMAQDFHAAFGLGFDDKTISTLDADGVALAAIQGLLEELKERDKSIRSLEDKIHALEERLDALPPDGQGAPAF